MYEVEANIGGRVIFIMKQLERFSKRTPLVEQLPLGAPLGVHISPSTYCNFKCRYCEHTLDREHGSFHKNQIGCLKYENMSMETFELILGQLKELEVKVKMLDFAWLGEPLLNPNLADMVRMAKSEEVADTVCIVTNGSLLTPELSDRLIDAGLDRLRVSLQGLSSEAYWEISAIKLNFEKFRENIDYFYHKKKHTQLYIKILDAMVKEPEEEKKFRELFENSCDVLNIEHLIPLKEGIDLTSLKREFEVTYFGDRAVENHICPKPFFFMAISPQGDIFPCDCADYCEEDGKQYNRILGNVRDKTISEVWNGKELRELRLRMIYGEKDKIPLCNQCNDSIYSIFQEDRLDGYEERLATIYEQRGEKS